MSQFTLEGSYRVQSRRDYAPAVLEGEWYCAPGLISNDRVNRALQAHPLWQGITQVVLRPAVVSRRIGKFASEPDILYKRELFIPSPGTALMTADIVDVLKAKQNWIGRVSYLNMLFPDDCQQILQRLHGLELIIANEYVLHEAGHFLAYDVCAKQRDDYFTVMGSTAWPLVYLEELRADLNAFGFAVQLLSPEKASQLFLYNLMLRFGVHREGIVREQGAPYGLVPYLLFYLLQELGFINLRQLHGTSFFRLISVDTKELIAVMEASARHAEQELNALELVADTPLNRAISAASYVRHRLDDTKHAIRFARVMNQPTTDKE